MSDDEKTFIPLTHLAERTGLSEAWLRGEALAGRIPCLQVNRRLMFNPEAVDQVLLDRAQLRVVEVAASQGEGGEP